MIIGVDFTPWLYEQNNLLLKSVHVEKNQKRDTLQVTIDTGTHMGQFQSHITSREPKLTQKTIMSGLFESISIFKPG